MTNTNVKLTAKDAKKIYKDLVLVRKFEEKCTQLYSMQHIAGFLHLYIGQEAIATGLNFLKKPEDTHITSYRCHAHALLQAEIDPKAIMAELTGKITGCSKGKGGSMHIYSKPHGFYGGNGIVGAQIPLGTGCAFAHKYNKDGGINFAYMGDGALPQGQVYEAFNMASLWKLPIIYIVENNKYSMGTPLNKTHSNLDFTLRGKAFNIPAESTDGMDIINVINTAKRAIEHVNKVGGPYFIEFKTYRYRGHSMSDPQKYRSKEEVDKVRNEHDPIDNFEHYALAQKLLSEEDIKSIQNEIKQLIKEVEDFAVTSAEPSREELYTDVYI